MHASLSRPKLGLALGSGAARGLAHIGVLKVLEEADIPIDIITGTSMGAFIGAMYAAGVPVAQMEQVALELDWLSMARLLAPVLPTSGLSDGKKLVTFICVYHWQLQQPTLIPVKLSSLSREICLKRCEPVWHSPGFFHQFALVNVFWLMVVFATQSRLTLPATSVQRKSSVFAQSLQSTNILLRHFFQPDTAVPKPSVAGAIFSTHAG